MIIVNIWVPALEQTYNFSLDEKAMVEDLVEELVELISQKEQVSFQGNQAEMVLCSKDSREQFRRDRCLADYGVESGSTLLLT